MGALTGRLARRRCCGARRAARPLATGSGESLEERIAETALVETHAEMGEQLLPWVVALALAIVAFLVLTTLASRRSTETPTPIWAARWVSIALAALTVIAASGAVVEVARIGHSGAEASWSDVSGAAQSGPSGAHAGR